jgi:transposase
VISGIVQVLKCGCRWCDCPETYGPSTTIYNRFVRWARRGVWENLFRELARSGRSADMQMINSTYIKAHRSAAGGKGGSRNRLLAARAAGWQRWYASALEAARVEMTFFRASLRPLSANRLSGVISDPSSLCCADSEGTK